MKSGIEAGGKPSPAASHSKPNQANRPTPTRLLSCRMTRNYGAVAIEFGVEADFVVENESDQQRLWLLLEKQVNDMHDEWALNRLPNIKAIEKPKNSEIYHAQLIFADEHNGKTRYKIQSVEPMFNKYGCYVTPIQIKKEWVEEIIKSPLSRVTLDGYLFSVEKLDRAFVVTRIWKEGE